MLESFPLPLMQKVLFAWYERHRRDLPWRKLDYRSQTTDNRFIRDPYKILVSELMLQQTQVARVQPKYEHFLQRWPTIQSLAGASLSEVITEWKGLGYNRRAKHLLEAAKIIVHEHAGSFPRSKENLSKLPGFGPYMVSAIRVFAFGEQDAVIDVNITRVLSRVEAGLHSVSSQELQEIAKQSIPSNRSDEWHQMLMDFGSLVCTGRSPQCSICPVSRLCRANRQAQAQGYTSFAAWLHVQPKVKKISRKDVGKRFEETDRYFRGRIIDFLRSGEKPMEELQTHLLQEHRLDNLVHFGRVIESLVVDGLIRVKGNTVQLA